ncbi:MAG: trypsin-like serine protease [Hydrogenophaga sp.]
MDFKRLTGIAAAALVLTLSACGGGGGDEATLPSAAELCNSAGVQPKILGGSNCANPSQSPVVQLVVVRGGNAFSCSGVMLMPTRVLTAAHCLPDGTQRVAAAVYGASGAAQLVRAQSWVRHPGYSESPLGLLNDAAVVTLGSAMPNPTMPLLVSSPSRKGNGVYIAGWGLPSGDLAVGFAVLSDVTDLQLQVTFNGNLSNTCVGDSGGPAYRAVGGRQGVVGLTSSGTARACGAADNSLFTNTQSPGILSFIRAQAPGAAEI